MASKRVLVVGGHGKVALALTPLLLQRSWSVTSVIRDPSQKDEILALGKDQPGKVDVLIESLDDVKSDSEAKKVLDQAKPDYVVWSAGAGGKGGAERTFAVDRDAAIHYINATRDTPSVSKFLMISYIGSRRSHAAWWSPDAAKALDEVNNGVLANYYKAKIAADEALVEASKKRGSGFAAINLRPGSLTEGEATKKVQLGKTDARGKVRRTDVAEVAARLLEKEGVGSRWIDLLEGDEDVDVAVDKVVKEDICTYEGEGKAA